MKTRHLALVALGLMGYLGHAADAAGQTKNILKIEDMPVRTDSAATALIGAFLAAKCDVTCREIAQKREAVFRIYPENKDGISFLKFTDIDSSGTYDGIEISYAEFSDASTDIVVENKGDTAIELQTRVIPRDNKTNSYYLKAKAAYDKNPAPLDKNADVVVRWIIRRDAEKPHL